MRSPIKTVIKNKTDKYYRIRLDDRVNLNLSPAGERGDTIEIEGDAFTLIDRTVPSDLFMDSILSGKLEASYIVDSVVPVTLNSGEANFKGAARVVEAINKANAGCTKQTDAKTKETTPVEAVEQPKVQEPVIEPAKPVDVEAVVENVEEPVTVSEDTAETEDKPKAEDKPKRQRKIKVD